MRKLITALAGGRTHEEIEALLCAAGFQKIGEQWKSEFNSNKQFDTKAALEILIRRGSCLIIRDRKTAHGIMDLATGKTVMGPPKIETAICGTPLFSRRERQTGVCRSCASGYSVTGNHFTNEEQRKRAIAAHDCELQPEKVA